MGVVTRVHGSGAEAVISVVYGMNIEIKFIAKNILKIPSGPESSKPDDDSDSGDDVRKDDCLVQLNEIFLCLNMLLKRNQMLL